jgi:hypothetical protein
MVWSFLEKLEVHQIEDKGVITEFYSSNHVKKLLKFNYWWYIKGHTRKRLLYKSILESFQSKIVVYSINTNTVPGFIDSRLYV